MMDEPESAEADNKTKMAFAKMQAPQALRDACVLTDADFETIRDDNSEEGDGQGMDPDQADGLFLGGDLSIVSAGPTTGGDDGGGSVVRETKVAPPTVEAPAPAPPPVSEAKAGRGNAGGGGEKKKDSGASPPTGSRKRAGGRPDSPGTENEVRADADTHENAFLLSFYPFILFSPPTVRPRSHSRAPRSDTALSVTALSVTALSVTPPMWVVGQPRPRRFGKETQRKQGGQSTRVQRQPPQVRARTRARTLTRRPLVRLQAQCHSPAPNHLSLPSLCCGRVYLRIGSKAVDMDLYN